MRKNLLTLLNRPDQLLLTPCAHDALSAKLIQHHGFEAVFVSGFGVAASKGLPDTNLLSFREVLDASQQIIDAVNSPLPGFPSVSKFMPVICDADTGYGNEFNVRRTVSMFHKAGASAIMLEDQVAPKRCGHTIGKTVVNRQDAIQRIQAACDARDEACNEDIAIIARTDARAILGLEEALRRAEEFVRVGADVVFIEAPQSKEELQLIGKCVNTVPKMCNMLLGGVTPELDQKELLQLGFKLAAYPFDLLIPAISSMNHSLEMLKQDQRITPSKQDLTRLWSITGFNKYVELEKKYK